MRGRRGRCKTSELVEARETEKQEVRRDSDEEADEAEVVKGFFACYLLCSLSPRHKCRTYIGFTVNPQRRIKQHNGEKRCGAQRTKLGRPWEMVLCIYGFPSNVSALKFEWAWQHPTESLAVRKAASSFKSLSGIANKIKLAYAMLTLPCWQNLNLTVNFFSTKYAKHIAGCPRLPNQMRVNICCMDDLPCYAGGEALHCSNINEEVDDGEGYAGGEALHCSNIDEEVDDGEGYFKDINIDQMGSSSPFWEPEHYISELSKSSEEFHGSLSQTSRIAQELDDFEYMKASTSSTVSSSTDDSGMGKVDVSVNQSTPRNSDNDTMTVSPQIDVINLSTPSSGIIQSKTKRALFDSDVIDLTDSPLVIQL